MNRKSYPSFFEDEAGLPSVDEHISTGFPSFHQEMSSLNGEKENEKGDSARPKTGAVPSFYSAFDLED